MKKNFKITLCVLVTILLAVMAFAGVYTKKGGIYESILPKYSLESELMGKRTTYFKIAEDTKEELLTEENYEKVKEIFEGRFEEIGVTDYKIRANTENGEVVVELAENSSTDTVLQYLLFKGDFEFADSEDDTVLLSRDDVERASVVYGNNGTGSITVYLQIKFNKEGTEKLAEVSREYVKIEKTDSEEDTESDSETVSDEQKLVRLTIEGTDILTTYFSDEMTDGNLTISLGSGTDTSEVYDLARQAGIFAMLINNEELPFTYTVNLTEQVESEVGQNELLITIAVVGVIALVIVLYMVFKYNKDGLLSGVAFVSGISMFLLLLRYTATEISLSGIVSMTILVIAQAYFMISTLSKIGKDEKLDNVITVINKSLIDNFRILVVLMIVAIVFTFMPEAKIFSVGMMLFYGLISLAVADIVFLRTMLIENHK